MSSLNLAAIALPALAAAAIIPPFPKRQEDGDIVFEPFSDLCLTAEQWSNVNPNTYDEFFSCFVRIENDDGTADLYINNVPDSVLTPDGSDNNNTLCQKAEKFTLPNPVKTDTNTRVPQTDAIAISVGGVKIFGPLEGAAGNAVSGFEGQSVTCDGHAQPAGIWHYHHPEIDCVVAASTDLVAWSLDGFPIYGALNGTKDEVDEILDECNGLDVEDSQYGYQYHVRTRDQVDETTEDNDGDDNTDNWKYFLGCYRGETYNAEAEEVDDDGYCAVESNTGSDNSTATTTSSSSSSTSTAESSAVSL